MIKQLFALAAVAAATLPAQALTAGDLAFTSFNADEDGFSMVPLVDLAADTKVFFSDNTFNGSSFSNSEAAHSWTSGAAVVQAGTVIRFSKIDSLSSISASVGTISFITTANLGLSATAETIYAYTSATDDWQAPTSFLAAVSTETTTTAITNAGLSNGISAVQLTNSTDYGAYTGVRSGESAFAAYTPLVNNSANWTVVVGGDQSAVSPDLTSYSVTAVPEPGTYALLLAGLAAVGFVARRRS